MNLFFKTNFLSSISRQFKIDFAFISFFLTGIGVFFVPYRPYPTASLSQSFTLFLISIVGLCLWWAITYSDTRKRVFDRNGLTSYWVLVSILIVGGTFLVYAPISLMHFDTGTDLTIAFGVDKVWFPIWAEYINRPLASIGPIIAMLLSENSLDGFLIVNILCRLFTGLLLVFICYLLYPNNLVLGLLSGVFFSVNHSELSQFNLWSIYYNVAVTSLFFAIALWIYSYKKNSRISLGFSCLFLGFSLLQYEHGYFLAAATPILLFLIGWRDRLFIWTLAWWGTLGIFALRLISFMRSRDTYHVDLYATSKWPRNTIEWLQMIAENAYIQIKPIFNLGANLSFIADNISLEIPSFFIYFILLFQALLLLQRKTQSSSFIDSQSSVNVLIIGICASVLGVIVFFGLPIVDHVPDYATNPTMRYQYFSAVGHSIFWAGIVCIMGAKIRNNFLKILLISISASLLCIGSISESFDYQEKRGALNSYLSHDKSAATFRAIKNVLPNLKANDLIFFELPDNINSPIGWNYTGLHYSCRFFGSPMNQGKIDADGNLKVRVWSYSSGEYSQAPTCETIHFLRYLDSGKVEFIKTVHQNVPSNLPGCKQMCLVSPDQNLSSANPPYLDFKYFKLP